MPLPRFLLCHPIQRYKFESNSQQLYIYRAKIGSCVIRYKDTNLKAIHNTAGDNIVSASAVSSDTKIQIWKQFTTKNMHLHPHPQLCHPIQRYKFESNSQPLGHRPQRRRGCVIRYKDTNLKAIHNCRCRSSPRPKAVSSDTKIQIWKQFTTSDCRCVFASKLCHPIQRYKFESNSQQVGGRYWQSTGCVIRYKDTNLKAIHNTSTIAFATTSAVSSDTKIQIWKQFTTHQERLHGARKLCHPIQRYKFESNSQPLRNSTKSLSAVSSDTKIQIWKQFTTDVVPSKLHTKLCHPIQRYKFESNSQQMNNYLSW